MNLGKPSTPIHRGGASSDDAPLLVTIPPRPRRLGGLQLALAAASLSIVLWVLTGTFTWQAPKYSGSADQVLLTTPSLRTDETNTTQQSLLPESNSSSTASTSSDAVASVMPNSSTEYVNATQKHSTGSSFPTAAESTKKCEKMDMGHIEKEFSHPERCFSRSDIQQIILRPVWKLAEVFDLNNIPYWLDSGTLLGSHREKTIIPYDGDADIGITEASYFQLCDNKLEFPSEYELQVFEGKFHRQGPRDDAIPARLVHRASGLYIDIFVFLDNKKDSALFGPLPSVCFHSCYRCTKRGRWTREFTIPRDWVYPLQSCPFGGRNVSCPAEPELYMDYLYGPNYMTPDKKTE